MKKVVGEISSYIFDLKSFNVQLQCFFVFFLVEKVGVKYLMIFSIFLLKGL